ncbi:MAG TPA: ribosome silencing factor [Candidatus Polarisedimenticolia bacterium]
MRLALEAANDKKAEDPVALNLKGIASFTDSFIICGGQQRRQTQAICDAIVEALGREDVRPGHVEGYALGDWILIDFADLVVHIFTRETRGFYNLERLWGDAPRVALDSPKSRKESEASAILKG